MRSFLASAAVAIAALTGVVLTVRSPTAALAEMTTQLVLPRPTLLKALGRSHLQLVTDFYWLKTLNRTTTANTAAEGKVLLALGDLIVALDPDFRQAYWLVGLNGPFPPAERNQPWINAVESAALLERGLARFPLDNNLVLALAYNLMSYQLDYVRAARVLEARVKLPDALPYFAPLATRLLAAGGQFDASRELARAMVDNAPDFDTRKVFIERLKLIDLEEQLSIVEAAAKRYYEDRGAFASTVTELLTSGYLKEPPVDPFGGVILLNQLKAASTASRRLEVYQ